MAHQGSFFGQQSMLKIIRSARSHLRREQSVDDAQSRNAASHQSGSLHSERQPRRSSTARSSFDFARQTSLPSSHCENAVHKKPQQGLGQAGPVLSDVTNISAEAESRPKPFLEQKPAPQPAPQSDSALLVNKDVVGSAFDEVDVDTKHSEDPAYVVEYVSDIFRTMQKDEDHQQASPGYMERQAHVNIKMRGILVDWLVSVQQKYKLKAETLFLTVSLLDRYLEKKSVERRCLQLVGVTSLMVAAKFEEIYPPKMSDLVYVTDKAYSKDDIIKMEVSLLSCLDFKICSPTPMHFLERYQSINCCSEAHRSLSQYLLELGLADYNMLKYSTSCRAASAVFLSNKLLRRQPAWKAEAVKHSHFTEAMLKDCAKETCALLENVDSSPLQAVRKKFCQLKHHSVAKLNFAAANPPSLTGEEPRSNVPRRSVAGERRRSMV